MAERSLLVNCVRLCFCFFVIVLPLFISGCHLLKTPKISVYTVEKESVPDNMAVASEPSQKQIVWKTPSTWIAKPASEMRIGSFSLPACSDKEFDVSIVTLEGIAGGLLSNVNRWRGQLQLEPVAENDLKKMIKPLVYTEKFDYLDLLSLDKSRSMMVAILNMKEATYFFKAVGSCKKIDSEKTHFLDLLKSVHATNH